jgi:EAL domain-containing protein (putative c-di-GMP-specific phosphodiesterase class I)
LHTVRKLAMVSELRTAIASGELALHYQPQIDLRTGEANTVEALLRWHHPEHGVVSPGEFIMIAESTDLIHALTEWSIVEALSQSRRWQQNGFTPRIAVNLSARVLQDVSFPRKLKAMLATAQADPSRLELEITESAMMLDAARALRVVREVHALGVVLSIDDFGTGFSSLGYLRDLPVHALKLDRSFVMHLQHRAEDRVIVDSTVQMAHALKLQVVAEGVETRWAADYLRAAGFDYAQGFLFSGALSSTECERWMRKFNASVPAASSSDSEYADRRAG